MNGRNQSLDVLRFAAILLVFCCHYELTPRMQQCGIGVDLFFVLSGFLISGLLYAEIQRTGSVNFGRFFIRRGFKIYPPFYFFLALTGICFPWLRPHWGYEAAFLQNYYFVPMPRGTCWIHLWSLAVEEHFYIALPLLLLLLLKLKRFTFGAILGIWSALAIACLLLRVEYLNRTELLPYPTHLRIDELFAGVVLGYLYHFNRETFERLSRAWMLPAGIVFLVPIFTVPQYTAWKISLSMMSVMMGFALIVWWAVPRTVRGTKQLAEIGKYSYSIYLWQMPISLCWHPNRPTWLGFAGYILTSVSIGIAMSLIIEQPALALRDRLTKTKASPVGEASSSAWGSTAAVPLADS